MSRADAKSVDAVQIRTAMLRWFARNKRSDPWRLNPTPYSIWVAEVMLQQTVVAAVVPYFKLWMKRFPTLRRLAQAPEQEVLRAWEGLGYYSRARNLRKAAQVIVERHNGQVPQQYEELVKLPGIGDYTASAILSIAYKKPYPVIDANVRRVVSRILGVQSDDSAHSFLQLVISKKDPGKFNEAIMELGQTICRVRSPICEHCPIKSRCRARELGIQSEIPLKTTKTIIEKQSLVLVVRFRDKILLQENASGLFAGMRSLPRIPLAGKPPELTVERYLRKIGHENFEITGRLKVRTHKYTKYSDLLTPIIVRLHACDGTKCENDSWVALYKLDSYPLPAIDRKIVVDLLNLN